MALFGSRKENMQGDFDRICREVQEALTRTNFDVDQADREELVKIASLQKRAILGDPDAIQSYKKQIEGALKGIQGIENVDVPSYYPDLVSGIFEELYGFAGLSEWFTEKYARSSSAKIIGNRIFYMVGGNLKRMPQEISDARRDQLIKAFLLNDEAERSNKDHHEIFMLDGTRVTVYEEYSSTYGIAKQGQEAIVLRRYIVPEYSFEEQAKRGTIPVVCIPLFKAMIKAGFNVAFTGAVRSAKTTLLTTWQSYEDRKLEGVLIETNPEIPLHKIMPEAPIMQLIADENKLKTITAQVMRSDADYIIMGEARTGLDLNIAVTMANKGTRRCKMTFHTSEPGDFPYNVAGEITTDIGGNMEFIETKVAKSFDFIFHMRQLDDKSKKRLDSIWVMYFDPETRRAVTRKVMQYNGTYDEWTFFSAYSEEKPLPPDKRDKGCLESKEAYEEVERILTELPKLGHLSLHTVYNDETRELDEEIFGKREKEVA